MTLGMEDHKELYQHKCDLEAEAVASENEFTLSGDHRAKRLRSVVGTLTVLLRDSLMWQEDCGDCCGFYDE